LQFYFRSTPVKPNKTCHVNAAFKAGFIKGMEAACRAWKLDKAGVARVFAASREYDHGLQDGFYALPCTISGQLPAQDKIWTYRINAASTATWTSADLVRTFGCSANACKSLVLMMPDNNAGP